MESAAVEGQATVNGVRLLLRVEEAAERLGIGRSLMYHLIVTGAVESVPVGRLRRIPCEALDEYVDRLRTECRGRAFLDQGRAS